MHHLPFLFSTKILSSKIKQKIWKLLNLAHISRCTCLTVWNFFLLKKQLLNGRNENCSIEKSGANMHFYTGDVDRLFFLPFDIYSRRSTSTGFTSLFSSWHQQAAFFYSLHCRRSWCPIVLHFSSRPFTVLCCKLNPNLNPFTFIKWQLILIMAF